MKKLQIVIGLMVAGVALSACGEKKKTTDIITQPVAVVPPQAPIAMQEYSDERDVSWIDREYHVSILRQPCDSLSLVKDETGQEFVDNVFSLAVSRADGSVFFRRTFVKRQLASYLDDDFRRTGIFEGLVFDRVDGDWLVFAASVGHPQTDEYIPLVLRLSRYGDLQIQRDTQMDTNAGDEDDR